MDVNVYLACCVNQCTTGVYGSRRAPNVLWWDSIFCTKPLSAHLTFWWICLFIYLFKRHRSVHYFIHWGMMSSALWRWVFHKILQTSLVQKLMPPMLPPSSSADCSDHSSLTEAWHYSLSANRSLPTPSTLCYCSLLFGHCPCPQHNLLNTSI